MPRKPDDDIGGPPPSKRSDYAPGGSGGRSTGRSTYRLQEPFVSPSFYVPTHSVPTTDTPRRECSNIECSYCFHRFKTVAALEGHLVAYHPQGNPQAFKPGDAQWTPQYAAEVLRCFKCGKSENSRIDLENHIGTIHHVPFATAIYAAGGNPIAWKEEESPVTTPASTVPFHVNVQRDEEVSIVEEYEVTHLTRSGWHVVAMIPRKVLTTGPQKYDAQGRSIPEYQDSFVYLIAKKRINTQPEESKTMATDVPKTPDKTMDMLKRNFTGAAKIGGACRFLMTSFAPYTRNIDGTYSDDPGNVLIVTGGKEVQVVMTGTLPAAAMRWGGAGKVRLEEDEGVPGRLGFPMLSGFKKETRMGIIFEPAKTAAYVGVIFGGIIRPPPDAAELHFNLEMSQRALRLNKKLES